MIPRGGPTHTHAVLGVPQRFFDLVLGKLKQAGYDHAIDGDEKTIDMHGLALQADPEVEPIGVGFSDSKRTAWLPVPSGPARCAMALEHMRDLGYRFVVSTSAYWYFER